MLSEDLKPVFRREPLIDVNLLHNVVWFHEWNYCPIEDFHRIWPEVAKRMPQRVILSGDF